MDKRYDHDQKDMAIVDAKRTERKTGKYHYVMKKLDGTWEIVERMPFGGEYYDADGIRHGG